MDPNNVTWYVFYVKHVGDFHAMGHNSKTKQGGVIRSRAYYATHFCGSNRRGAQTSPELSGKHPCLQQRELCKESFHNILQHPETTQSRALKLFSYTNIQTVVHSALQNDQRSRDFFSQASPNSRPRSEPKSRRRAGVAALASSPKLVRFLEVSWKSHGKSHTLAPGSTMVHLLLSISVGTLCFDVVEWLGLRPFFCVDSSLWPPLVASMSWTSCAVCPTSQ